MKKIQKKWMLFIITSVILLLNICYTLFKGTEAVDVSIAKTFYVSNYYELSSAIAKANSSTNKYKIILEDDIQLNNFLQIGSDGSSVIPNVILDLQSYYITSREFDNYVEGFGNYPVEYGIKNYGNLEITATTGGFKTSSSNSNTLTDVLIANHNTLIINGGNYYDGATVGTAQIINNYGKMTINGGSYVLKKHSSIMLSNNGELTINDAMFDFTNLAGSNYESFVNESGGKMTINGGSINGGGYGIVNYSQLDINGGTILGNTAAICNGKPTSADFDKNAIVNVKNGTIVTETKGDTGSSREVIYNSGVIQIDGGEFKITNSVDDLRVSILFNYGVQTINGGTFVAETTGSSGYVDGIRNLSNSSYTNLNGGLIKLKSADISSITSLRTFYSGTTNIDDSLSAKIESDGIYKFIKLVDISSFFSSDEGDGTIENPYQIYSVEQLNAIRYFPDKNFILMNDLELEYDTTNSDGLFYNNGLGWEPIGKRYSYDNDTRLTGVFDGNYHIISGLYINRLDEDYVGLFGDSLGIIKNVAIINSEIKGNNYVGSIAGRTFEEVNTVYTANNVQGNEYVGGVVGSGYASTKCFVLKAFNLSNVQGKKHVSGVGNIKCQYCYNTGIVEGDEKTFSLYTYGTNTPVLDNYKIVLIDDFESVIESYSIKDISLLNSKISDVWDDSVWEISEINNINRLPKLKKFNFEHITDIDILDRDISLLVGDKIKYQVIPANNYNKNVVFVSNDESVVTFHDDGTIATLNDGITTISIYSLYDGYKEDYSVSVKNGKLNLDVSIYEVVYETNGGTIEEEKINVIFGDVYGKLNIPFKRGYIFDGWYLDSEYKDKISDDSIVTTNSNHILYAKWRLSSIDIGESNNYEIKNNLIDNVLLGTRVENFKLEIDSIYLIKIFDKNNNEKSTGLLATGDKIEIYLDDNLIEEYFMVVNGDLTGDGILNREDILMVSNHIINSDIINLDEYLEAADYDGNNKIDINDIVKMYRKLI